MSILLTAVDIDIGKMGSMITMTDTLASNNDGNTPFANQTEIHGVKQDPLPIYLVF